MFRHAIARKPGRNFAEGITTAGLGAPDFDLALEQHAQYCAALRACGLEVTVLDAEPDYPDGCFVEDVAVLSPRGAVLTRPGALPRRGEVPLIRDALARHFARVEAIAAPGTLEGGDVCEADGHYFIGLSERTNAEGAGRLGELLGQFGYTSTCVDLHGRRDILHLKSGMAYLGDRTLVVWESLAEHPAFAGYRLLRVAPVEAYAANCVRVNDRVLVPAGYPGVQAIVSAAGYSVVAVGVSEYRKMDGGLSCLSLRF